MSFDPVWQRALVLPGASEFVSGRYVWTVMVPPMKGSYYSATSGKNVSGLLVHTNVIAEQTDNPALHLTCTLAHCLELQSGPCDFAEDVPLVYLYDWLAGEVEAA